ncbi:MAG: hypothetical protein A3J28_02750 [Acidobacteria bacterium RIFCSPLOWO2_12_FULL_60_22]|nr:MAG: hypothetical protein A3J28_02750 [Acidobacteria bacterium RIFCSPLOWO2_12_FULL_60_22]
MMNWLLNLLFGCGHGRLGLPITVRTTALAGERRPGTAKETYRVCLECGKKFPYSWDQMKIVRAAPKEPREPAEAHRLFGWLSRHRSA